MDDIPDAAFAAGPKNLHQVKLKAAECELLGGGIVPMVKRLLRKRIIDGVSQLDYFDGQAHSTPIRPEIFIDS